MTGDDRAETNPRAIRELTLSAFSAEELQALVAYYRERPRQYARFERRLRTTPDRSFGYMSRLYYSEKTGYSENMMVTAGPVRCERAGR